MIKLTDILSEILTEKKLCPKGEAYRQRRLAAGEVSSAYLSGRAFKVCQGLMDELLNEEIDPSEAYNDTDAINTLVKRKRDLAFIVQGANTENNWAKIQKTIKDNDIRIMYVKGNPHHAYIAYLPGSENKATKLKDLAEKYDGYLSAQATKEDTIQIGRLLGYKEDKIKEYVNKNYPNDPIKEGKYDDKGEGAGYDLVKQNPFDIKKLVDKGIIFVTKPGDGKGGLAEPNWEGDLSIITYYNIKNKVDPWMIDALNNLLLQSIPYVQKSQDKLIYNGKYNQILWGIEKKGLKPEDFYLNINESLNDWFKKKWVRIDTQGNITGPCGTMKKGKATTRCLPRAKANSLTKDERAATARKKVAGSKKGKQFVPNTKKAKVKLNKENLDEMSLKQGLAAAGIALSTLLGTPDTSKASTPTSTSQVAAKSIIEKVVEKLKKKGYKIDFLETAKYKNFNNAGEDDIKTELGAAQTETAARLELMKLINDEKLDRSKTLFMFNSEEEKYVIIYTKR